jgi:hypothetical protein
VLESMAAGVPVIRLEKEALDADPLLDAGDLCRVCRDVGSFCEAVTDIFSMDDLSREKLSLAARTYAASYLKPFHTGVVQEFMS